MTKKLQEIIDTETLQEEQYDVWISSLHIDSREVLEGGLFFALPGVLMDRHDFIPQAIQRGAKVIIHEKEINDYVQGVVYIKVSSVRDSAGEIASRFFDRPSEKLKIVGVTGTNGKTSIATMLYDITSKLGFPSGLLSTVVNKIKREEFESTHTTGDIIQLQQNFARMVEAGCEYCFMEVSSHALEQGRVVGVSFAGAIFTNLTQDHLDYHETMENYAKSKKILFDILSPDSFAIINKDNSYGNFMISDTRARVVSYGTKEEYDFPFALIENSLQGIQIKIQDIEIRFPLIGYFNAYNVTAVMVTLESLGLISKKEWESVSHMIRGVPGRMELVPACKNRLVIVDYAHTPDALENVLRALVELRGTGKIITLFGAGGDRDRTKRPLMSSVVAKYSQEIVITSDNPRTESPEIIFEDLVSGLSSEASYFLVSDRKEAIQKAITLSHEGDIVLLAGKGHEEYQIIGTEKIYFSDKEEVSKICLKGSC